MPNKLTGLLLACTLASTGCLKKAPSHDQPVRFASVDVSCRNGDTTIRARVRNHGPDAWSGSVVLAPEALWQVAGPPLHHLDLSSGEEASVVFSVVPAMSPHHGSWTGEIALLDGGRTIDGVAASCTSATHLTPNQIGRLSL